ncbi:outer spore coat protein CotE [Ornithinibacillus sp. 4-3]|uniref:Outer spore coat protein CotE n=1 Tax=Ornithinibacillus sp. 4-3 TaxID=3231488 RepID=A0AB39HPB0_9BACI
MSYLDKDYREIITKAVCGKGKKFVKDKHKIEPLHRPSSILGCWIINHEYQAVQKGRHKVEINGSYDINIWYSYSDNTKTEVVTERVNYCDEIPLTIRDDHCISDDFEIIVRVVQQPNCLECVIEEKGNRMVVEVEREFVVKVIGETKVFVRVDQKAYEDKDSDDWDEKVTDEELRDVSPDFLRKKRA